MLRIKNNALICRTFFYLLVELSRFASLCFRKNTVVLTMIVIHNSWMGLAWLLFTRYLDNKGNVSPANIYLFKEEKKWNMFKVNHKNKLKRCHWDHYGVFIVTLNIFHTLFSVFIDYFEQAFVCCVVELLKIVDRYSV